jgi:hypothetical protein
MRQSRKLTITTITAIATLSLVCPSPEAAAHNVTSHPDLPSTRHIAELPPEIVKVVNGWQSVCGSPIAARQSFAHYLEDKTLGYRLISLHFRELSCDNKAALCTNAGCLHQVYVSTDGTYRLAFSANVRDVTLTFIDHKPALEVDCDSLLRLQCSRILRWNGHRFDEQ